MEYFETPDNGLSFYSSEQTDAEKKQEMFTLRNELATQLTEMIWLFYHTVPQYLMHYAQTYGKEELELVKLRSQLGYTRRLIARIRERNFRGKTVHFEKLVRQMEEDPATIEAQAEINAYQMRLYNARLYRQNPELTIEQCTEMKQTMLSLLLVLHPFLNAEYDETRKVLLERVTQACNRSRPEDLWIIEQEVAELDITPFEERELTPESVTENILLLRQKLAETQKTVAHIRRDFPMKEQEILDNPVHLSEHWEHIRQEIREKHAELKSLEQTIQELLEHL